MIPLRRLRGFDLSLEREGSVLLELAPSGLAFPQRRQNGPEVILRQYCSSVFATNTYPPNGFIMGCSGPKIQLGENLVIEEAGFTRRRMPRYRGNRGVPERL